MSAPATAALPVGLGAAVTNRVGIGILGATGYTGAELVRLLSAHPGAELLGLSSRRQAGHPMAQAWPALAEVEQVLDDDVLEPSAWQARGIDVVFSALPHGAFARRARAFLDAGMRVVDLSADFRLTSAEEYRGRYGMEHPEPSLLGKACYGLTEWCGSELAPARLVANPGCYPTAVLLATLPALRAGWWNGGPIVANALSGVSGAGRAPSATTHFVECGNSAAAYRVGEEHSHLGEMRQAARDIGLEGIGRGDHLGGAAPSGRDGAPSADARIPSLIFNPHLVPMARGILASVAVPLAHAVDRNEAGALYLACYQGRPFVRLLAGDALPETRNVRGSNRCDLALRVAAAGKMLLVFAAIDNLIKGAAGQAVQNWNLMQGWSETTGLPLSGWACA